MNNFELVVKAYNELIAEHKIFPCAADVVDLQKALLTRRAGYYLNGINPSVGLLSKTSGNNVQGLSVDCLFDKQFGMEYDIGTDVDAGGGKRMAQILDSSGRQQTDLSRWVKPQREWCDFATQNEPPVDNPPVDNPPVEEPEIDLEKFTGALAASITAQVLPKFAELEAKLTAIEAKIKPCPFLKIKF